MKTEKSPKELTTPEVLAEIFPDASDRPQTDWLLRKVRAGEVPFTRKVGRNYLFDPEAVRKALREKNIIT